MTEKTESQTTLFYCCFCKTQNPIVEMTEKVPKMFRGKNRTFGCSNCKAQFLIPALSLVTLKELYQMET